MKIGVMSDLHDDIGQGEKALQIFQKEKIEAVLFCGDLVCPSYLKILKDWPWEIKAIFGNNEGDKWGIARRFKKYNITNIEYSKSGLSWELEYDKQKIVTFHGHSPEITKSLVHCGFFDLVCTGHDHEAKIKKVGKTLWINPGSVKGWSENSKVTRASVAIYDTKTNSAKIIYLK